MSNNLYQFHEHRALSPAGLFLFIALDETRKRLGFDNLAAAASWLLGQNDVPVPGKMKAATEGTSVVSIFLRKVINKRTSIRLPTLTWKSVTELRIIYTTSLAGFIGRLIPVAGATFMTYDATVIMYRTVKAYNAMVKPEDQL
ncbi:putative membrane protein [Paraburkholderia piptadeniae]|uniref:Membrane protein n=1 Tax=Paraburkholderia piptadeniae TaxID=1701573 RepID=A0A1N7SSD9_9BURK|nr:hypothetical protein [Paraburkholderia piptadeniae]SIT50385.1 putative membrane protein [Paraburkholderia piptadeniae]